MLARVKVTTASYVDNPPDIRGYKELPNTRHSQTFKLEREWKSYAYETDKCCQKSERVMVAFGACQASVVDLDDCVVTPVASKKK